MFTFSEFKYRCQDNWIINHNCADLLALTEEFYHQLILHKHHKPNVIISERHPIRFLAEFMASVLAKCPVFLCNPDWGNNEWEQVFNLVQPDVIFGDLPLMEKKKIERRYNPHPPTPSPIREVENFPEESYIMIPTGGSSGNIRFTIHSWQTLSNSVAGFQQYFALNHVNSFCVLPLYHVSGLMQFMRSFITGGKLIISPFKLLTNSHNYDINEHEFFISLVPTQLQKIFTNPDLTLWLSQFKTVLLGGGNSHEQLLIKARSDRILLSPTYGMTETASQIATLKPEYFLNGHNSCGNILPHVEIFITNEQGEILGQNKTGIIHIKSDSLCLGYYPNFWSNNTFITDDLGMIDHQGFLHILGRNSQKIITGGENVFPPEVENTIKSTNLVKDVCIIGLDDPYWGQMITAIYVPINDTVSVEMILQNLQDKLSKFKHPKSWFKVESLPRNSQGKVNLQQVKMMVKNHLTND